MVTTKVASYFHRGASSKVVYKQRLSITLRGVLGLEPLMSGRGAFYKNLYGGRGRGRGKRGGFSAQEEDPSSSSSRKRQRVTDIRTSQELVNTLFRIDGKPYPAYHDVEGTWRYDKFLLHIDHVQSDPYAPPSKLRLQIGHEVAQFPASLFSNSIRKVALCDFLTRGLASTAALQTAASSSKAYHSAKGGEIFVDKPGQQVLQRSSVVINSTGIEARFTLGLPAQGRTILGGWAVNIFRDTVPRFADQLLYESHKPQELEIFVNCIEDQDSLREKLSASKLSAFIPNGAILPRASGSSDLPLSGSDVVKFVTPPSLECIFELPHRGEIRGMGIPEGITMIAGGGFHGKSTLLDALAVGCYNHIPGDGREFVVSSPTCVSVQGEDGRSIKNVDISPFISHLPSGVPTTSFTTQDASGSTSMAAGVIEALELGAKTLLFDEDTCATNFLIRDRRMQRLVSADPITPLVFKIRALHRDHGCSAILVIGGCGDYCDVADNVLEMRNYQCYDITQAARQVAKEIPSVVADYEDHTFGDIKPRALSIRSLPTNLKVIARARETIQIGENALELSGLRQLVHQSQTRAIAATLEYLATTHASHEEVNLKDTLDELARMLHEKGPDMLVPGDRFDGFLVTPRVLEIGMAINRLVRVAFYL
ncbi:hypothetical protein DENSPDRAFT_859040 [Dentipellis sp. KUC8613]|nr:hypothetical protein DENSPDRAFT_859040 [Dentipellis sp. KUC8613]